MLQTSIVAVAPLVISVAALSVTAGEAANRQTRSRSEPPVGSDATSLDGRVLGYPLIEDRVR